MQSAGDLPDDANFCYECFAKMEAFEYELKGKKYILKGLKDTSL